MNKKIRISEPLHGSDTSKKLRIAINGFGRIGRLVFRHSLNHPNIEIVAINDLSTPDILAHLLKYDSAYGKLFQPISHDSNHIIVNNQSIPVFQQKDLTQLPWKSLNVDMVMECTGKFRTLEENQKHLTAGAKFVVLSVPPKDKTIKQIVLCVNPNEFNPIEHKIISMASCTTNSAVPLALVLDKEFGIENAFLTTTHAVTMDQNLLDSVHKDLRRSRNSLVNIIPTTTGAAKAIGIVMPHLSGKLDGVALRVPISVGSITDFTAYLKKPTTVQEINAKFKQYAQTTLKGFLEYSEEELVSSDIVGNPHACILDSKQTMALGNLVKVLGWYDNEYAYSGKLLDLAEWMAQKAGMLQ